MTPHTVAETGLRDIGRDTESFGNYRHEIDGWFASFIWKFHVLPDYSWLFYEDPAKSKN